ncbi:predicted protein [Streptomyces sviceus ATCC 29083]|uniref:Uncharacterized protein n=1 Tax=Streptomyces sviceus (strain ATCC 29083 / DSM 924 / JCM 4929 / NBRC 13980 / NCIMB 11184 / NRRL 5439 / UC 5370) TaxID=463191 RepID=D6XAC4_STRX2|nr:predicted protein [Streptomyces sviceus ATCC 29083]
MWSALVRPSSASGRTQGETLLLDGLPDPRGRLEDMGAVLGPEPARPWGSMSITRISSEPSPGMPPEGLSAGCRSL